MTKISFSNKNSAFFEALKADVNKYFEEQKLSKTGDYRLYLKTIIISISALSIYFTLLFVSMPWYLGLATAGLFGFSMACIGFNIMHDACHGSYSTKKWVNNLFGLSMNVIGSNAFIWKQKHNVIHHTYTNIDGVDDDIAKSPVLRHCSSQPYANMHRYQHIYMFPIYGISTIFWALFADFQKYFTKRIYKTRLQPMDTSEHIIFWLSKAFYAFAYVGLPIYLVGFTHWLYAYLFMNMVFGLTLSVVFQLAHVVEVTEFEQANGPEEKKQIEDWAVHQVLTTCDFAPNNKIISWLVGGLNFQVEHHLFPRISHVHYPAIQPLVKKNCEKFGIRYNCIDNMGEAIASHVRTMRILGRYETPPQLTHA